MKKYFTAVALMVMTSMTFAQTSPQPAVAVTTKVEPVESSCVMFFPASGIYVNLKEVASIDFKGPMGDFTIYMTNGNAVPITLKDMTHKDMGALIARNMRACLR